MLRDFIQAAMSEAKYESIDQPGQSYYGEILSCPGVQAVGATPEECQANLEDALDGWLLMKLQLGHQLPTVGGIRLESLREAI